MTRRRLAAAAATLLVSLAAAATAAPAQAQAEPEVFRTPGREVVCAFFEDIYERPYVSCYSRLLLGKAPEEADQCGSGSSAAKLRPTGRVRLGANCNPYDAAIRAKTMHKGRVLTRGSLRCVAEQRWQIRCQSRRSGHGFRVAPKRWSRW